MISPRSPLFAKTSDCVYKTLCPKPLDYQASISAGKLLISLFQRTKSETTSCNSFWDILTTSFRCPYLQRATTRNVQRAITRII